MKKEFLDLDYMQQKLDGQEAAMKVKTGLRAGSEWPPVIPPYGLPPYGVTLYGVDPAISPAE